MTTVLSRSSQIGRFAGTAARYYLNAVNLAVRQDGWLQGGRTAASLSWSEARKLPRALRLMRASRHAAPQIQAEAPILDLPLISARLSELGAPPTPEEFDRAAFTRHMSSFPYPRFYAGGPIHSGGLREAKILEYFLSLELLPVAQGDLVVDVASERSLFPDMVNRLFGTRVLRQDLIYPEGLHNDRMGGSADNMPLGNASVEKLFLHNSFEHFEGDADTSFIREAWRVLKPGGGVCIVPLYLSVRHQILTDPLVPATGVTWDPGAEVVERIGHHNRFGRCYSPEALNERILKAARDLGFTIAIHHFVDVDERASDPITRAQRGIRFAMVLQKPTTT
jgi:SAM-dependent methyltransferase